MNQLKRRLLFVAIAAALLMGAFTLVPGPVASGGECECVPGYNYAYDQQPCSGTGTNCSVCTCPPSGGPKNET
jgi:hypothetical protein